jgi:hypothetical protein
MFGRHILGCGIHDGKTVCVVPRPGISKHPFAGKPPQADSVSEIGIGDWIGMRYWRVVASHG